MTRLTQDQFARLVREHHAAVYRSARRFVGDAAAAADVTQEVFLRAWRGKVRLPETEREGASLCWLATKLGHNAVRARRRRTQHEEQHHKENVMPPVSRESDPAVAIAEQDLNVAVQQCLAELPDDLLLPLELHFQDELTLAAVGSFLRLSTSTVHDRVQRGLQRLRQALTGRGFAVGLGGVPHLLQTVAVPAVPVGLEAQLLAIGKGSAIAAADGARRLAALGIAAVLVGSIAVGTHLLAGNPQPKVAVAATAATPVATEIRMEHPDRVLVPAERPGARNQPVIVEGPQLPAQDPQPVYGRKFVGTVRDAAHWPVVGATVAVIAGGGLKPFELARAKTDFQGAFEIEVSDKMRALRPTAVRLSVSEDGVRLLLTDELVVPRKDPGCAHDLVLPAKAGVATERYEWRVTVQDAAAAALAGVKVTVFSEPLPMPGAARGTREAIGTSGADGVAQLRGRKIGAKWLFVDGRGQGYGYSFTRVDLDRVGQHQKVVKLSKAGSLLALIGTVDGERLGYSQVYLYDEETALYVYGHEDPKGGMRFTGLGDRRYTLHVSGGMTHSPALVRGVMASASPVTVSLKLRDDVRDVGDHMGELHGTVLDAETGKEIALPSFATEVLRLRPCASSSPFDGLVPPPPAQRMASDLKVVGFHEVGLKPGRYGLLVDVVGYARAVHEFTITDRELHTGLRIPLHRGATVTGRVVDAAGEPVAGAAVLPIGVGAGADDRLAKWHAYRSQDLLTTGQPSVLACQTRTDNDGAYVLQRVPPGIALRVLARKDGKIAVGPLGVSKAGDKVVAADLQLRR